MKHWQFLRNLGQLRFTGQLTRVDPLGQKWIIYLFQGQIVYATGGIHPMRRWRRNLVVHCPKLPTYRLAWQADLAAVDATRLTFGWEYALLERWVSQKKITPDQAAQVIHSTVKEILFDMWQAIEITDQIHPSSPSISPLQLIDVDEAIAQVQAIWQTWQVAKLADYSLNQAPVLKQPEQLQKNVSPQFYQSLANRLNGQHTLRDLAVEMQRDAVDITRSLLPCLRLKWIELAPVADLPALIYRRDAPPPPVAAKATVACVDDSSLVRNMMEELLTSAGYQFIGVGDALRAIGILLARKPDFIFLDLMMPQVNGYEICEQLRKLSHFRTTPIVILTGNDGFANRLRSNFVGATDFLSKPLNAETVLNVIHKHLKSAVAP